MAKSKIIGVSAHIDPHSDGRVEATFYRYEKGRHPACDDWMQVHKNLTVASCRRLWRIVDGGSVTVWPDRLSIFQKTDEAFWSFEKQQQRNAAYWEARAYDLESQLASFGHVPKRREATIKKPELKTEVAIDWSGQNIRVIYFYSTDDAVTEFHAFGLVEAGPYPNHYSLQVDARYDIAEVVGYIENYGKEAPAFEDTNP